MPRIVFRCDASRTIGSGHIARCMALAQALRERGADIELVSRGLPERVRELHVASTGAVVHDLPPDEVAPGDEGKPLAHAHWLSVSQEIDAAQTIDILRLRPRADWLITDHYALDERWERAVEPLAANILVIDDLADRAHACDALLDQNFFLEAEARYAGLVPPYAELMLGPRFALLRAEFSEVRKRVPPRDGKLRRIFVCFGGFDAGLQTVRALEAIATAALTDVTVDIVIGSDHPHRRDVEAAVGRARNHRLHVDAENIAELMAPADLAIGASGGMSWERASLCLPAIVASVAENQYEVARDLAADRACIYLGLADEWRAETLAGLLRGLHGTPTLVRALAARAGALTDGQGARRVAERLLPEAIELRPASAADCVSIHAWRNAEDTRRHSLDSRPIPLEEHRRWFERVICDAQAALLIGERRGSPVGVLRYDIGGESAVVSIYVVPGKHGQGLGTALLRAGSRWMRKKHPGVMRLRAEIRPENSRSLEAFANAGYRLDSHTYALDLRHEQH